MSAHSAVHRLILEERPELPDDDVSIVRLAKDMMLKLGVQNDGHVLLKGVGFRQTVGIAQEAQGLDRLKVSISASARRSLRVRAGDRIMACAYHGLSAGEYVRLAPIESASLEALDDLLTCYLQPHFCGGNRPVSCGDMFVVRAGPRPVEFEVVAVSPGRSIVVSAETQILCDDLPVQRDAESKRTPRSPRVPFSPLIAVYAMDLKGEELLNNIEILRSTRVREVKNMIKAMAVKRLSEGMEATVSRVFLAMGCGVKLLHCRRTLEDEDTFESEAFAATVELTAVLFVQTYSACSWGHPEAGGNSGAVKAKLTSHITRLYRTSRAFAAMSSSGGVVTWGDPLFGGDSSRIEERLSKDVLELYSNICAFAAIQKGGHVVTWGDQDGGGNSHAVRLQISQDVTKIYSTDSAFAAVKLDRSVVTWGMAENGGDSSMVAAQLSGGVLKIVSSEAAFTALMLNGDAVAWGHPQSGGDAGPVSSHLTNIKEVISNRSAFAALSEDGHVYTWGDPLYCGYGRTGRCIQAVHNHVVAFDVAAIHANHAAFVAVKHSGKVVTWGNPACGGDSASAYNILSEGAVVKVYSNDFAFAAITSTGAAVAWGDPLHGGDSSDVAEDLASGVSWMDTNPWAFAAVKENGAVVTWGEPGSGGNSVPFREQLADSVTSLCHTDAAFAALKSDGSVVTWGEGMCGGDSQGVAELLKSGVTKVCASQGAFAALKDGGSVITWGNRMSGGDSLAHVPEKLHSELTENLSSGVADLYSNGLAFAALREGCIIQS